MKSQQNIKILSNIKTIYILLFLIFIYLIPCSLTAQNSKFTVVLDAGHGGKDPGTLGLKSFKDSYEGDVVLKVIKKIGAFLAKDGDIKTVYTRKTDKFIELHKRGKIANKANADLFISIHCNSAVTKAYGTTTYVLGMGKTAKNLELSKRENSVVLLEDDRENNYKFNPNNPNSQEFIIGLTMMQEDYLERSIEFAGIVQNKFKTVAKRKNRGVNQGNLAVLYDTYMPSVLIEIGFLTNKQEEKYLNSSYGQKKIAESIYKAILTYKKRLEKNSISEDYGSSLSSNVNSLPQTVKANSKFYRIQIATSRKKIETKSYNFRGLHGIDRVKVGNVYKYFYGITNKVSEAKKLRLKAIAKGYKDAFIARFIFDKKKNDVYKLNYVNPNIKKEKKNVKTKINKKVAKTTVTKSTLKTSNKTFEGIIFKVQISSSVKKIETKSYNFKGLNNIERVKVGSYYKYYYGKTNNYNKIMKMYKQSKEKGYKGAFIVVIENGKRISLREVLKRK